MNQSELLEITCNLLKAPEKLRILYCSLTEIRQETHWIVDTTGWFNPPSWNHTTHGFAWNRGMVPQGTLHIQGVIAFGFASHWLQILANHTPAKQSFVFYTHIHSFPWSIQCDIRDQKIIVLYFLCNIQWLLIHSSLIQLLVKEHCSSISL